MCKWRHFRTMLCILCGLMGNFVTIIFFGFSNIWPDFSQQATNDINGGQLTFGGFDPAHCESDWTFVPVTNNTQFSHYWEFQISGFAIGNETKTMDNRRKRPALALIDFPVMLAPPGNVQTIAETAGDSFQRLISVLLFISRFHFQRRLLLVHCGLWYRYKHFTWCGPESWRWENTNYTKTIYFEHYCGDRRWLWWQWRWSWTTGRPASIF